MIQVRPASRVRAIEIRRTPLRRVGQPIAPRLCNFHSRRDFGHASVPERGILSRLGELMSFCWTAFCKPDRAEAMQRSSFRKNSLSRLAVDRVRSRLPEKRDFRWRVNETGESCAKDSSRRLRECRAARLHDFRAVRHTYRMATETNHLASPYTSQAGTGVRPVRRR